MTITLYQTSADGEERVLELCFDETTDEETVAAELSKLDDNLAEKVEDAIAAIQSLKATVTALKTEIKRLNSAQALH